MVRHETYTTNGHTLTLKVATPDGSGESATDSEVVQNECDEIKLETDFLGVAITEALTRK